MPRKDLDPVTGKEESPRATQSLGQFPAIPAHKGGRPKAFAEATIKVALFLPPDLAGTLKALAAKHRVTPSLVVADWIQKAEVQEAIAQGRQAFARGDVVSHEEALETLSKW
jgi:predicted transcriptional regulator